MTSAATKRSCSNYGGPEWESPAYRWGDWRQEGIYAMFNPRLANPAGWRVPQKIQ